MCLTLPGKIISINKNQAKVDLAGRTVNVKIAVGTGRDLSLRKNHWVLVYGDLILEKISEQEANQILQLFGNSKVSDELNPNVKIQMSNQVKSSNIK